MAGEQTNNFTEQGGNRSVYNGIVAVNDENLAARATFTISVEAGNVINVAVQLKADADTDISALQSVTAFLSDNVTGIGVAGTAPNLGVSIGTDGSIIAQVSTNKVFNVQCSADGKFDVDISSNQTPTFYLVIVFKDGRQAVSGAIAFT